MPGTLTVSQWLDAIDEHYLKTYIAAGGSSIKFAACFSGIEHGDVARQLRSRAEQRGFLVADVDSAVTKVHLIEQLFGRIADQVRWQHLSERMLARFARANHWDVPSSFTTEGIVEQIAQANQLGVQQVSLELQRRISTEILANRGMAKEFRVAMHWLARARLESGAEGEVIHQHLTDWLGGRTRAISELRRYQIFTKVNRANARHLLGSLLAWIREAGYAGLAINIDGYRMLQKERAIDGTVNYTKAALYDAYEVFREFIDSTDEMDGLLLTTFVPPEFIDLDLAGRGLGAYAALLFRVYDEVRDRNLANPLTALTRISDGTEVAL